MKKALWIVLVVVVLGGLLYTGFLALQEGNTNKVAAECLRGNQAACAYFQAQENVTATEILLQEAKANLINAREAYKASQQGGE